MKAEQFQNLLRAIAANATGYAFEVALGAMCKECLETMETLQKKIQALNQGFANSCQLAKGLVNDVADAFDVKHKDNTSLLGMVKGLGDVFETRSSAGGADPIAQVRDNLPPGDKTRIEGNLVWQALKRKGAAGWFAAGEDTLLEAMMSLTGRVIVGPPEAAPDGQGDNHRITYLPGNLLKASDLLNGTRDREDAAEHANAWPHLNAIIDDMDDARLKLSVSELDQRLTTAAEKAAVTDPTGVSALALWHTYVLFLIRQGIDTATLHARVGSIPPETMNTLLHYVPPGGQRPASSIEFTYPVLVS